jgi:tetratricopeptide (TPR) repeat protein
MVLQWARRAVALNMVIIFVTASGLADAQAKRIARRVDDNLVALGDRVRQLYEQGNYAAAIPIAEQYVDLALRNYGDKDTEYGTAIAWLADVYKAQGRYAEAEPLYKRALAIAEKALGPNAIDAAIILSNLAALYRAQGRYAEAEALYKRALAIARNPTED